MLLAPPQVFSKVMKGKYNLGADSANIVRPALAVSLAHRASY